MAAVATSAPASDADIGMVTIRPCRHRQTRWQDHARKVRGNHGGAVIGGDVPDAAAHFPLDRRRFLAAGLCQIPDGAGGFWLALTSGMFDGRSVSRARLPWTLVPPDGGMGGSIFADFSRRHLVWWWSSPNAGKRRAAISWR
jgi:hypothetical protein